MRELSHGRLKLQVPEDWLDQSTVLFVAPRPSVEPVPAPQVTSTFSVRFAFGAGLTARQLVEHETGRLTQLQPSLELKEPTPFESALGPGYLQEVRLTLGTAPIVQLAAAWVVGELGIIACASCGARELDAQRPALEAMLRALRL